MQTNGEIGELYILLELLKISNNTFTPLKAYRNQEGWDIACISTNKQKICTIQVKFRNNPNHRNLTNDESIMIYEFDFLAFVTLENNSPISYIIPKNQLEQYLTKNGEGSALCTLNTLGDYRDNFQSILNFFQEHNALTHS